MNTCESRLECFILKWLRTSGPIRLECLDIVVRRQPMTQARQLGMTVEAKVISSLLSQTFGSDQMCYVDNKLSHMNL